LLLCLLLRSLPLRLLLLLLRWRLLRLLLLLARGDLLLGLLPICRRLLLNLCFVRCQVILEDLHHVCFNSKRPHLHLRQQVWDRVREVQLHFGSAVNLLLQADIACRQQQQQQPNSTGGMRCLG
jgi:hypothetical protein